MKIIHAIVVFFAASTAWADEGKVSAARDFWNQGGVVMYFIAALSILGIGCAIERFISLRRSRIVPDGFTAKTIGLWREGKFMEVADLCEKSPSVLARVVETMLQHRDSKHYEEVKQFAEDKAARELRLENRKLMLLSTAATLAPLLGLFGTVTGLRTSFNLFVRFGGKPEVLAGSINTALVTTIAGLAVSMPCLFIYGLIKSRLSLYAVQVEEEIADLVNGLFVKEK